MTANRPFDETLYRLLEGENTAAGAAELKSRIDRDPQFAADFDRTRKTVISLQGLAPRPAEPRVGTFSQRDFDRLTKDVLKGYKGKLAEVCYQLGAAYLVETPQKGFTTAVSAPLPSSEQSADRLQILTAAASSVAGSKDALLAVTDPSLADADPKAFRSLSYPQRAVKCFHASRAIRPTYSLAWSHEAQAWIRLGDFGRAGSLVATATDLVRGAEEKDSVVLSRYLVLFCEDRFAESLSLIQEHLKSQPNSWRAVWNRAIAKMNLHDTRTASREFCELFALSGSQPEMRAAILSGIRSAVTWKPMTDDTAAFDQFVEAAEVYLGRENAVVIRAVQ